MVLALSKASAVQRLSNWLSVEPSTEHMIIPTRVWGESTQEEIERFMRIYFPRTYADLCAFEFYYLAQTDMAFLTPIQELWIRDALNDHPKGGVNTRSVMSEHEWYNVPWADSPVSEAFPNDADAVLANQANLEAPAGPVLIKDGEELPGIVKDFKEPLESMLNSLRALNTIPKQGSVILSCIENNAGLGVPVPGQVAHIFYWRWNRSTTFTFSDQPLSMFWNNYFALDITANVIWFATGRRLPDDPLKIHEYRRDCFDFNIGKMLLMGLLDFAEGFGANSAPLYRRLNQIEGIEAQSRELYLDREFDAAYQTMKKARVELKSLEGDAANLKDRALLWVYIVEWLSIAAASFTAGFAVWSLMVRRTLYREVLSTRTTETGLGGSQ